MRTERALVDAVIDLSDGLDHPPLGNSSAVTGDVSGMAEQFPDDFMRHLLRLELAAERSPERVGLKRDSRARGKRAARILASMA